jgi:hypothetical protein
MRQAIENHEVPRLFFYFWSLLACPILNQTDYSIQKRSG